MIEYGGTSRFMERFSSLDDAEDCQRLCQGIPLCVAWTHHEASKDCSLHTKDEGSYNRGQKTAGVLECRAGFVGCFRSYPWRRPWNNIFMGYIGWSRSYLMHSEIACIESCRGMETALYAIYTRAETGNHWRYRCDCANDQHLNLFGGRKDYESQCAHKHHWVN